MQRDEIYLIDMWRLLRREWLWFLAVFAMVLLATVVFLSTVKPQWQASAWIQIGQVGAAPAGQDPKAEPLQRVLERLQLVPFQNQVLQSMGVAPKSPEAGLYRKSLKLEPLAYAGPLIKLSVRAHSAQRAQELAEGTVAQLQAIHRGLEAAQLKLAHQRLQQMEDDLRDVTAERDRLQQVANQGKDNLAFVLMTGKNDQIRSLEQSRNELLARLSASYTYDTSLMWPVYVPEHPVFPNPLLIGGMGLVLGLFLGVLAAVASNAVRRRSAVAAQVQQIAASA